MADTPEIVKSGSSMPYVWAIIILFLIGVILVGLVLFLRPAYDPMIVITSVLGFIVTISTGVATFLKSQETHMTVNSQLTAWKAEFKDMFRSEGVIAGTKEEQARVAEQKRVAALTSPIPPMTTLTVNGPNAGVGKEGS